MNRFVKKTVPLIGRVLMNNLESALGKESGLLRLEANKEIGMPIFASSSFSYIEKSGIFLIF